MANNLKVEQIAAPDFSGIASLMTGAGTSFNNAFDAANSVLGKYQKGQEAKADSQYLNALGGIRNEQELTDFFLKNPLGQANLSAEMRKTLLEMRDTVIGYDVDRATASNTNASADSTRASTGRETVRFQDEMAKLAADRAMAPGVVDALVAGQTTGQADWLEYKNQGATRNDPLDPKLVGALSFLGDMGVRMEVISGGQEAAGEGGSRTGSTRHDHGQSADADFYVGDRKLDPKIPEDRAMLATIATRAAENGVTGFGEGEDYMGSGRMHIGYGSESVWGAGGKGENAPDWLVSAVNAGRANRSRPDGGGSVPVNNPAVTYSNPVPAIPGGAVPGPNGYTGGAQNGYLNNPAIQSGIAAIRANKYLTATEAEAQIKAILDAAAGGQDAINARDEATQKALADQAQLEALTSPGNVTLGAIQGDVLNNPNLRAGTALAAGQTVGGLATGALQPVALPGGAVDPSVAVVADAAAGRIDGALASSPEQAAIRALEEYKTADDPVAKLIEDTNAQVGFFSDSVADNRTTRETIQAMADEARVGVPEMAATLFAMTDQEGYNPDGTGATVDQILKDFRRGTGQRDGLWHLAGHTGTGDPIAKAAELYGPGANYDATTAQAGAASAKGDIATIQLQIQTNADTLAKLRAQSPNDPQIAVLEAQNQSLATQLNQVATPAVELVGQLKTLPKGSPEYLQKAEQLVQAMETDSAYTQKDIDKARAQLGLPKP